MKRRILHGATAAVAGAMVVAGVAVAAQGDLDTTFGGGDGQISIQVRDGQSEMAYDSVLQPNGKLISAGYSYTSAGDTQMLVARVNKDGSADLTFGLDQPTRVATGVIEVGIPLVSEAATSVTLQPDGKVLVVGYQYAASVNTPFMVRLTKSGALDATFGGGDGQVEMPTLGTGSWTDVVALPDGKSLLLGLISIGGSENVVVARVTKTGALDPTYGGGDGFASFPDVYHEILRFAADSQGRAMVAAFFSSGGSTETRLLRLTKNGALDTSFGGGDGSVVLGIPSGRAVIPLAVRMQPDGKALVIGTAYDALSPLGSSGTPPSQYIGRVTARGVMDTTFGGGNGWVNVIYPTSIVKLDVQLQSDGRIVLFGGSSTVGIHVARFTKTGDTDSTFGAGTGSVSLVGKLGFSGAIQPDGRLVAVGYQSVASISDVFAARYQARSVLPSGRTYSARSLLAFLPTIIPKGARFGLSVSSSSRGSCVVSRGGVKGVKAGVCRVTVSMTPPATTAYPRPTTIRSRIVLTVTN